MTTFLERMYPDAYLWLVGSGFGGGAASVGTTFYYYRADDHGDSMDEDARNQRQRVQAVTFNAPGDFWYLRRAGVYDLGSMEPPRHLPIVNIGTASSPLFSGQRDAPGLMTRGGYPLQTTCRSGLQCLVEDFLSHSSAPSSSSPLSSSASNSKGGINSNSRQHLQKLLQALSTKARHVEVPCQQPLRCPHECSGWTMSMDPVPREVMIVPADSID
jgi:hypothetical protein